MSTKRKNRFRRVPVKKGTVEDLIGTTDDTTNPNSFKPKLQQQKFTDAYLSDDCNGNMSKACEKARVARWTAYEWMKDPGFEAWFREESRRYCLALEGLKLEAY